MNEIGGGAPGEFRVIPLLAEALCRDSVRPTVAICYASGYAEDLEQCQFIRREIGRLGIPAILCNPENLTWNGRELAVFGRRIDAVYRFFPCEWLEKVDSLDLILAAARSGRLNMINGFASIIAQSKKTMALWHERADLFDADDRALIERHVPKTTIFVASKGDRYRRERERLVVKRQFGRMGEEVLMGCLCANDEWADWLSWPASEAEHWVVQERVDSVPVEVDGERLYGCFGPYVVGGRFAGLYNRFAQDGFIANDALVGAVLGT